MALTMRDKKFWRNLTKRERSELMRLQMSPSYGGRDGYLPDDCSECGACGQPMLGSGWCNYCLRRWQQLVDKAQGRLRRNDAVR